MSYNTKVTCSMFFSLIIMRAVIALRLLQVVTVLMLYMTAHLQLHSCGAHRDRGKERWRNYYIQHSRNHFKEETEEYFSNSFVRNSMINTNMVQTSILR